MTKKTMAMLTELKLVGITTRTNNTQGDGINELKFKFGSGYRIYYSELDDVIVLLLCAGDKKTQSKDIKLAKEYLIDYLKGENHG